MRGISVIIIIIIIIIIMMMIALAARNSCVATASLQCFSVISEG